MNIVLLAEFVVNSGVGVYIDSLCTELRKEKYNSNIYIVADKYDLTANRDSFMRINTSQYTKNIIKNVRLLRNFFKAHNIEVVQMNHRRVCFIMKIYNTIFFYDKMPCCWVLHTQSIPYSLPYRMVTYKGNKTIAISSEVESFLIKRLKIKASRIERILNGINNATLIPLNLEEKNLIKAKYGIKEDSIVFCMHCRIDRVKGIDVLIKALSFLPKAYRSKVTVLCSGNTENNLYYEEMQSLIKQYEIQQIFKFTGWVTAREIIGVSDLLIAPSRREGNMLSAIEALFMKVPCLRTATGGYIDMKEQCDIIEIDNYNQLAMKIIDFMDKPRKYDAMVEQAYEYACKNYTIEVMAEKTRAALQSIAINGGGKR